MNENQVLEMTNKIFQNVFGRLNPYSISGLKNKFAFDILLPVPTKDCLTGEVTYTAMPNASKHITADNSRQKSNANEWVRKYEQFSSLKRVLEIWDEINCVTAERVYDSEHVSRSDPIYKSTDVYNSTNCGNCRGIIFCDGSYGCELALACQRSNDLNSCIRVDDSNTCSNSYNVVCCSKVSNSLFVQDASNLHECIFCSHISDREFCVANTPLPEAEYFLLKAKIIDWILSDSEKRGSGSIRFGGV